MLSSWGIYGLFPPIVTTTKIRLCINQNSLDYNSSKTQQRTAKLNSCFSVPKCCISCSYAYFLREEVQFKCFTEGIRSYLGPLVALIGGLLAAGLEAHSTRLGGSSNTGMDEKIESP